MNHRLLKYPDVQQNFTVKLAEAENVNGHNFKTKKAFHLLFFANCGHIIWLLKFFCPKEKFISGAAVTAFRRYLVIFYNYCIVLLRATLLLISRQCNYINDIYAFLKDQVCWITLIENILHPIVTSLYPFLGKIGPQKA